MLRGDLWIDASIIVGGGEVSIGKVLKHPHAEGSRRAFLAAAVEGNIEADTVVHEQVKRRVEAHRVAKMGIHLVAVDVGFEEPELHPVERRQERRRTVVHRLPSLLAEDAITVNFASLQMRDHEPRHVVRR